MAAQYDRIKKKSEAGTLAIDAPLQEVLHDRWPRLAAGAGGIILLAAIVYGVIYYLDARQGEAQLGLYQAQAVTPSTGATQQQADGGIDALNALISRGGPAEVMAQAHLDLATLHGRAGRTQEAIDEYGMAVATAEKGSILSDIASMGKANTLVRMGRYDDASAVYEVLSNKEGAYPVGPVLHALGLARAMAGKKDEAIKALNRLKVEAADYLPAGVVDDQIRRVDADEFVALARLTDIAAETATQTGSTPLGVHTGAE